MTKRHKYRPTSKVKRGAVGKKKPPANMKEGAGKSYAEIIRQAAKGKKSE